MDKLRYLSINQLSKVTGKDRSTISKRLEELEPYKTDGRAKIYDAHEAIAMIFAQEAGKGLHKKTQQVEYEIEKEKLDKIRMDNQVKQGKLLYIDDVVKTVEKEYMFIKAQIKSLPSRVSKLLSIKTDPLEVNQILMSHIDEILTELSSDEFYEAKMNELEIQNNESVESGPEQNQENDSSTTTES